MEDIFGENVYKAIGKAQETGNPRQQYINITGYTKGLALPGTPNCTEHPELQKLFQQLDSQNIIDCIQTFREHGDWNDPKEVRVAMKCFHAFDLFANDGMGWNDIDSGYENPEYIIPNTYTVKELKKIGDIAGPIFYCHEGNCIEKGAI